MLHSEWEVVIKPSKITRMEFLYSRSQSIKSVNTALVIIKKKDKKKKDYIYIFYIHTGFETTAVTCLSSTRPLSLAPRIPSAGGFST